MIVSDASLQPSDLLPQIERVLPCIGVGSANSVHLFSEYSVYLLDG